MNQHCSEFVWFFTTLNRLPVVMESVVCLQDPAKPLDSGQMPVYVLSIQERAEQLASMLEGKPARPEVNAPPPRQV